MKSRKFGIAPLGTLVALAIAASLLMAPWSVADNSGGAVTVNINTAEKGELTSLPGIGASKADAIIGYRSENGPFASVDDLTRVRGIGPGVLKKIRHLISTR